MTDVRCMHKGCGRRSNVFITNGAEMQTHDCCTKHPCARKLAEAQRTDQEGEL
jgi:hypothetical protein